MTASRSSHVFFSTNLPTTDVGDIVTSETEPWSLKMKWLGRHLNTNVLERDKERTEIEVLFLSVIGHTKLP